MRPPTRIFLWVCAVVIVGTWVLQGLARTWPALDALNRLEWMTYDWRMRLAAHRSAPPSSRLGFVAITDDSIQAVRDGLYGGLPYQFGLYWPRQVYGRLVHELAAQGISAVGFDILFSDLRPDHPPITLPEGGQMDSDQFFAREIRAAGNVILATDRGLLPDGLFRAGALALADISAQRESDGVLRRVKAFEDVRLWHALIQDAARLRGWDLRQARVEPGQLVLPTAAGASAVVPLLGTNEFDQAALFEALSGQKPPPESPRRSPAFTTFRCWQMGIVLAARALGLNLAEARVEPQYGRIVLSGSNGVQRIIPVDAQGRFCIDWSMTPYDPALTKETIESLLLQYEHRQAGQDTLLTNRWKDKLVVVGSVATGNDLTDLGATPLEKETYLISQQWNVAGSVLAGRFIRPPSLTQEWALALGLGLLAGTMTWKGRVLVGSLGLFILAGLYIGVAAWSFVQWRWWLPLVLPLGLPMLGLHLGLVTCRVLHEQRERQRVESVFGRIVSPKVRDELIQAQHLALGGVRREVTVLFADLRKFTQATDASQAAAEEHVRQHRLEGDAAREYLGQQAREVLTAVNRYLALIADKVKLHDGTLDKYIGDCVMAFWGAPAPNSRHAAACVRAMIEAQRTIHQLNRQAGANPPGRCASENAAGKPATEAPAPSLLFSVGMGINTGLATVGLIGSERHIFNYTVFGREVNLASRLEEIAAPGCVLIGESTFHALQRDDSELAALCAEQPPAVLKGFRAPVRLYAVKWQET